MGNPLSDLGKEIGKTDITGGKGKKRAAEKRNDADQQRLDNKTEQDNAAIDRIGGEQKKAAGELAGVGKETVDALNGLGSQVTDAVNKLNPALDQLAADVTSSTQNYHKGTKENQGKVQGQLDKIDKLIEQNDPKKLADELAKEQDKITKQKTELAQQSLEDSKKLSEWYKGIATSYEDIGKRYKDAVTGLSSAEKTQMRGEAQQDFAAMSAMGAQGFKNVLGAAGGAMTGNMSAIVAGASMRGATDAYSMAMGRMAQVDEQRRQMQFQMVQAASNDERANRALGASIQGRELDMAAAARAQQAGYLQEGFDSSAGIRYQGNMDMLNAGFKGIQTNLAGIDQMQGYNTQMFSADMQNIGMRGDLAQGQFASTMQGIGVNAGIIGAIGDVKSGVIMNNLGANTYADDAGIRARAGVYGQQNALDQVKDGRMEGARAATSNAVGNITGTVGAVVGGYFGGTAGAGAGYTAGKGVGTAAGDMAQK